MCWLPAGSATASVSISTPDSSNSNLQILLLQLIIKPTRDKHSLIIIGVCLHTGFIVIIEFLFDDAPDILPAILFQRIDLPYFINYFTDLVALADLDADAAASNGEDDLEELGGGVLGAGEEGRRTLT